MLGQQDKFIFDKLNYCLAKICNPIELIIVNRILLKFNYKAIGINF